MRWQQHFLIVPPSSMWIGRRGSSAVQPCCASLWGLLGSGQGEGQIRSHCVALAVLVLAAAPACAQTKKAATASPLAAFAVAEMTAVAAGSRVLDGAPARRCAAALARLRPPAAFDPADAERRLTALLALTA